MQKGMLRIYVRYRTDIVLRWKIKYDFSRRNRIENEVRSIPKVIVTEAQWLQIGMEQFARNGAEGLVIEKMAAELGCSKSSFYWYFKSRSEFIVKLVERWSELTTQQVIRHSSQSEKAEDQLKNLLTEMFAVTQKGDFLFYLRKLARENAAFQTILNTIEQTRMSYVQGLFIKLGMTSEAAEQKSCILYHYYLGWYERHKHQQVHAEERADHIGKLRVHLLGY